MKQEKSVNEVTVSGVLQDVVLRETSNKNKVANATIVLLEHAKDGSERRQYYRVVLWKGLASRAAALPVKSKVRVTGRLETSIWNDAEGQKKTRVQITASTLDAVSDLGEVPTPEVTAPDAKEKRMTGSEIADAILSRPHSSEVTAANPITDADVPF